MLKSFHNPSLQTMITLGVLVLVLLAGVQSIYAQGNATIVGVVSDSTKARRGRRAGNTY